MPRGHRAWSATGLTDEVPGGDFPVMDTGDGWDAARIILPEVRAADLRARSCRA
jgi:hypothetical protein